MNIVIYARYSSNAQSEQSIEGQLKVCEEFAQANGYTVVNTYIDRAASATSDNRPQFQKMIEDSAKRHFEGVLVYQLDRFARNRYDSAVYKTRLKKNGVRIFSARENITDDASGILVEGILESMAEYFSAELRQKVNRGMVLNFEKGKFNGGWRVLGLDIDDSGHFVIREEEAPIVRLIFQKYADGAKMTEIIRSLNAQGYRTPTGKPFSQNALTRILHNKKYIGTYTYKGKETEGVIPPIVSKELFERVERELEKNRKAPGRAKAREEYLLTTKLFCGCCKEMMIGISGTSKTGRIYNYYRCNGVAKKRCNKKTVGKEWIEDLAVQMCLEQLTETNIEKIIQAVLRFNEQDESSQQIKRLQKNLSENERLQKNTIDAIAECDNDNIRKMLYEKLGNLEEQRKEIDHELSVQQLSQGTIEAEEVRFFLQYLKKGNLQDAKYRKMLITAFIDRIYLYDDFISVVFRSSKGLITMQRETEERIEHDMREFRSLFLDDIIAPRDKRE